MRIIDPGNTPIRNTTVSHPSSATTSHTPPATSAASSDTLQTVLIERLNALAGTTLPAPERETLAASLAALGYDSRVSEETIQRALILFRNGVSLSPALLDAPLPEQLILLPEAVRIRDAALALLRNLQPGDGYPPVKALAESLEALLNTGAAFSSGAAGMPVDPESLARTLRRSGLMFEWRLLSWYREGRDPAMLGGLVRDDIKGVLLRFLSEAESFRSRQAASELDALEKDVRSLLDRITGRQLDHLSDSSGERRSLFLEIPFGRPEERTYAGLRARRDNPESESAPERSHALTIEIETTKLGTVRVMVRFLENTVAATFLLRNRAALLLAENMADEFREMLRNRGYSPGQIRFALTGSPDGYADDDTPPRQRLDRRG